MNKNNNINKSIKGDDSFDYELDNSNDQIPNKEYITYPEESVLLDLNLSLSHWDLSIEALKQVIEYRDINKEIKIKKENKYKKSLIINDLHIQIALCGLGAEEVSIPLDIWESSNTAPQVILVAQVDDENNIVNFPGILTGSNFIKYIRNNFSKGSTISIPISDFEGGVDILFSYVKFFNKNSLPRIGLKNNSSFIPLNKKNSTSLSLFFIVIIGIFLGKNFINTRLALNENIIKNNLSPTLNKETIVENNFSNPLNNEKINNFQIVPIASSNLNENCLNNDFSNITINMFETLKKDNNINLYNLNCSEIKMINNNISYAFLTTGRSNNKSVVCLTDDKLNNPCKFIIGSFKANINPNFALANATNTKLPKSDFLNETFERIFINVNDVFGNK